MASAGPYTNHLHVVADRQPCQHFIAQFLDALPDAEPTVSKH